MDDTINHSSLARLTETEFQHLSSLVYNECGINLPASKKIMLESRLNKRLRALRISSFHEYIPLLTSPEGMTSELIHMIDVVTTNKTDFFREPHHFAFLAQNILSQFSSNKHTFKAWSAACSSGEEPYTLAMVLEEFKKLNLNFNYEVTASDISSAILQKAVLAIYPMDRTDPVPIDIKRKYFLKSKDTHKQTVRIVPELRKKVHFRRINFMDAVLPVHDSFDLIFCRNALIYFDRKTQSEVVRKLVENLKSGGHLFIGHSESLYHQNLPLTQVKPTIYRKT